MPHEVYLVLHILGLLMTFMALGGVAVHAINGGTKQDNAFRTGAMLTHDLGLCLILLGGFGLMAKKLQITGFPWPGWLMLKMSIWIVLGGFTVLLFKRPDLGRVLWWVVLLLGTLAVLSVTYRPF